MFNIPNIILKKNVSQYVLYFLLQWYSWVTLYIF